MKKLRTLKEIVEQLERCNYKTEDGLHKLEMNIAFQDLKEFSKLPTTIVGEWIAVKDGLPHKRAGNETDSVWVYLDRDEKDITEKGTNFATYDYKEKRFWVSDLEGELIDATKYITHWMQLPSKPMDAIKQYPLDTSALKFICENCKHWENGRCEEIETNADLEIYNGLDYCNEELQIHTPEYFGCSHFDNK